MDPETCSHPACLCEVEGQQDYCSDECAKAHRAGTDEDLECNCGHAECEMEDVEGAIGDVAD